ncbi:type II secretion system protein GspE [Idiomarina tyrosinivorans]|uniref:Type II secretion system protein GspE n=1 Tax=Idiomarina tyrosinivorans TaxID=1445662 RepID=A0A432ZQ87_9GAMM|nr:GspE/PulE family protein [Idiomarina tyrosinivorans]RUO80064.1 type II secretion system protein GspE [Idiomarina tyrosinivorans]
MSACLLEKWDARALPPQPFSHNFLQQTPCVVLQDYPELIVVAAAAEMLPRLRQTLRFAGYQQLLMVCSDSHAVEQYLEMLSQPKAISPGASEAADDPLLQLLQQTELQQLSDIHIEPQQFGTNIRQRLQGKLQRVTQLSLQQGHKLITRIKVAAELDIGEQRRPQDGRLQHTVGQQSWQFRVSSLASLWGEKLVLRKLANASELPQLAALGLTEPQYQLWVKQLQRAQGLILVTGPTGSGKTTSLYAALQSLSHEQLNICSVEDPVEMALAGVQQVTVNDAIGLRFATILRALLRQDPDVILVGEIRDAETACIAVQAAQTGHLVLASVHTQSAIDTLQRLQQLGIAEADLAASLQLIISQRLVRVLCQHCRQQREDGFWQAIGCSRCRYGYRQRKAFFEVVPTHSAHGAASKLSSDADIQQWLAPWGLAPLSNSLLMAARNGEISVDDLQRWRGIDD